MGKGEHLAAADGERGTGAVDVFAVVEGDELRREENAEGILAVVLIDHVNRMLDERDGRAAVPEVHEDGEATGAAEFGPGGVAEETKGRGGCRG